VLLPELDEAQDLICLVGLADLGVGVAEHLLVGVLGQEREYALLAAAAFGHVVLLGQGVFAVERDGVKVQVEADPAGQAEPAHGLEPAGHQLRVAGRGDAAGVLGQKRTLRYHVQPGEQRQPLVENGGHGVAGAGRAEQLERQQ
jgi:hypothetical protein